MDKAFKSLVTFRLSGKESVKCLCGSATCRGTLNSPEQAALLNEEVVIPAWVLARIKLEVKLAEQRKAMGFN